MVNREDFFNNLPSPKVDTPVSTSVNSLVVGESVGVDESQLEMVVQEESALKLNCNIVILPVYVSLLSCVNFLIDD